MAYRTVVPRLWDDPRVRAAPGRADRVLLYLLTGPAATMLPGLQRGSALTVAEGCGLTSAEVDAAFAYLSRVGLIEVDASARLVRIVDAPSWDPPINGKVIKGWFGLFKDLPDCAVKFRHIESLRRAIPAAAWALPAWDSTFGQIQVPALSDFKSISNPEAQDSQSCTSPDPDLNQNQDHPAAAVASPGGALRLEPTGPTDAKPAKPKKPKPPKWRDPCPAPGREGKHDPDVTNPERHACRSCGAWTNPVVDALFVEFFRITGATWREPMRGEFVQLDASRNRWPDSEILNGIAGHMRDPFGRRQSLVWMLTPEHLETGMRSGSGQIHLAGQKHNGPIGKVAL